MCVHPSLHFFFFLTSHISAIASAFVKMWLSISKKKQLSNIGDVGGKLQITLTNRNEPVPWRILGYMRPPRNRVTDGDKYR